MALLPIKPGIFNKGKKVGNITDGSKPKAKARAKKSKTTKSESQTTTPSPPATVTGGGGKGGLPSSPRSSSPSASSGNLPVPKNSKLPRAPRSGIGQGGRQEKFMGNAQRVPNESLPGLGAKGRKSGAGKAAIAGGAVAAAALLYGSKDKAPAPTQTVSPTSVTPSASGSGPKVNLSKPPTGGKSGAMGGATAAAPTKAKTPKAPSAGSSSGSKRGAAKGESMADYLGLSKDSAVRTYMDTGKHQTEPKYPTGTGHKAGTPTKASKRTQKTR